MCFVYPALLGSHQTDTVDADMASQAGSLGRQTFPVVGLDDLFEFGAGNDVIPVAAPGVKWVRII